MTTLVGTDKKIFEEINCKQFVLASIPLEQMFGNRGSRALLLTHASNAMHQQKLLLLLVLSPLFIDVAGGETPIGSELDKAGTSILTKYCKKCHGDDDAYPGLDIADRNGLIDPIIETEDPFIVPGDAENSRIWEVIEDEYMPPEDHPQLSSSEKELLSKWIESGAKFPPEEREVREYIGEETIFK